MQVKIQTLTPLWTGGVDGSMDCIHETGIIGSMRWWYEAIVRGLGGSACDPSNTKCSFNAKDYRESSAVDERQRLRDAGLCDVCQVFGATGWRRRFRLDVVDSTKPIWTQENRMLNIRPPDRNRGWFLPPGRMGALILNFSGDGKTLRLLGALVLFLEKWGNLGAKPQLGYGVFKITNRSEVQQFARHSWHDDKKFYNNGLKIHNGSDTKWPDLRRFGFCRYRF
ncbi:MAG: type III-B CRISPR module RAMP protein Cmr1, partial [Methanothrix sp.]|nr:type III-B CRISPR module RAMP protein Cmr1 [Methanothrix sp.]